MVVLSALNRRLAVRVLPEVDHPEGDGIADFALFVPEARDRDPTHFAASAFE